MVITGLTRNQFGRNPTRVRIPLSAPKKKRHPCGVFSFLLKQGGFERVGSEYSPGDCRANPDRARRRERIPRGAPEKENMEYLQ